MPTTATSTQEPVLTLDEMPWQDIPLPPTDLPDSDGDKMESPWHVNNMVLLKATIQASRGNQMDDYYIGTNMFLYFSMEQVRNQDYKGPDVFVVKNVDGTRKRLSWIVWDEDGRYPDVIIELMSPSNKRKDLVDNKTLYEQVFRTSEYFCIAMEAKQLLGWRREHRAYVPIEPDERGWLWSEELQVWLGRWNGTYQCQEDTWVRLYTPEGELVLLPEEAAAQQVEAAEHRAHTAEHRAHTAEHRAQEERQRSEELAAQVARLEAELNRLRGDGGGDGDRDRDRDRDG